jgi:hypothetical protein
VAFAWRDPAIVGPFRMDQLLALGLVIVAVLGIRERRRAPIGRNVGSRLDYEGWSAR